VDGGALCAGIDGSDPHADTRKVLPMPMHGPATAPPAEVVIREFNIMAGAANRSTVSARQDGKTMTLLRGSMRKQEPFLLAKFLLRENSRVTQRRQFT